MKHCTPPRTHADGLSFTLLDSPGRSAARPQASARELLRRPRTRSPPAKPPSVAKSASTTPRARSTPPTPRTTARFPSASSLPRDTADVIATVAACREFGAPVLSRGGGTSLAGQCCNVAVVIDFSKYMNAILDARSLRAPRPRPARHRPRRAPLEAEKQSSPSRPTPQPTAAAPSAA
jgi:hypothetical protein